MKGFAISPHNLDIQIFDIVFLLTHPLLYKYIYYIFSNCQASIIRIVQEILIILI